MTLLESLCRLTGELDDENERSPRRITLMLSRKGLIVRGTRDKGFMSYCSHIVIETTNLENAIDPEAYVVEIIRQVRESLTFPEDRS